MKLSADYFRQKNLIVFLFILPLLFSQHIFPQAAPEKYSGVMLQGFYWDSYSDSKWTNLTTQSDEIAGCFDLIWLPPSGDAMGGGMGYLPVYYFRQNSRFGNQNELKTLISTLKAKGCGAIADIVINHRNGTNNWVNFPSETYKGITYTWGMEAICRDDECKDNGYTPTGANDTGEGYDAGRDIDHTNENVRNTIKAYLDFMKNEMGYVGWRYDYAKGFAPKYLAEYNMAAGCDYSVAEYFDGSYDKVTAYIDGTKSGNQIRSGAFDFPLKFALTDACNNNNWNKLVWFNQQSGKNAPAGIIHMDGFRRFTYTFIDNHDTNRADSNHDAVKNNIPAANAFIITQPGIPCVWLKHWIDHKDEIRKMIDARKSVGVHSQSDVNVLETANDIYVAEVVGTTGSLVVKVGTRYEYDPPTGYTLKTSGTNYAIWSKGGKEWNFSVSLFPSGGLYPGGTSVTLTASGGAAPYKIYYTVDGSEPTTSSAFVSSGGTIQITKKTTVKAMAVGNDGKRSLVSNQTYYTDAGEGITVKWKNDLGWNAMNLYAWDNAGAPILGAWPGTSVTADADGWYSHTFTQTTFNVIFNAGNGAPQTEDIPVSADVCYKILATQTGNNHKVEIVDCPRTSSLIEVGSREFSIYPNPASDYVYLSGNDKPVDVSIFTISGICVTKMTGVENAIDIKELPCGIYFMEIKTGAEAGRLVKLIKK